MARREYSHSPQCVHDGCPERANYYFETQSERRQQVASLEARGGWRCVRHTRPEEVLSINQTVRETVLESYELSHGRYFRPEHTEAGGSGFQHGPGFKAYANDFPPGTRLIVTARVELPEAR